MRIAPLGGAAVSAPPSLDATPSDPGVGEPVRQDFDAHRTAMPWRCRIEEPELLAERVRQAVWVILAATGLFALADLGIARGVFVLVYGLKLTLVLFLVGMLAWLRV